MFLIICVAFGALTKSGKSKSKISKIVFELQSISLFLYKSYHCCFFNDNVNCIIERASKQPFAIVKCKPNIVLCKRPADAAVA